MIVYFSSVTENTHRLVIATGHRARRIGLLRGDEPMSVSEPYLLVVPTYGSGDDGKAVPKQVIRFLNDPANRAWCRAVVATGNRSFGSAYGLGGRIVAAKCQVPLLGIFELAGFPGDAEDLAALAASVGHSRWPQGRIETDEHRVHPPGPLTQERP